MVESATKHIQGRSATMLIWNYHLRLRAMGGNKGNDRGRTVGSREVTGEYLGDEVNH